MWIPVSKNELPKLLEAIDGNSELGDLVRNIEGVVFDDKQEATRKYREAADNIYGCDEIEIDDDANISPNDEGGCWVQAWVYVRDEEAGVDRELDLLNDRGDDE